MCVGDDGLDLDGTSRKRRSRTAGQRPVESSRVRQQQQQRDGSHHSAGIGIVGRCCIATGGACACAIAVLWMACQRGGCVAEMRERGCAAAEQSRAEQCARAATAQWPDGLRRWATVPCRWSVSVDTHAIVSCLPEVRSGGGLRPAVGCGCVLVCWWPPVALERAQPNGVRGRWLQQWTAKQHSDRRNDGRKGRGETTSIT
jgi:hypothetical protein